MEFNTIAAFIIFLVIYGLIVIRNNRRVRIPIWVLMSIGAISMISLQIIPVNEAYSAINFDVIFL